MPRFFMKVSPEPDVLQRLSAAIPRIGWTVIGEPVPPGADPHWLYEIEAADAPEWAEGQTITPWLTLSDSGHIEVGYGP